jgi:DUF4097 and DUF4098 domain-containing protein YvlB
LNERLRILKLLEEGAITAEDAARLLEALSGGDPRKHYHTKIWSSLEGIPDIIANAIDMSTKFADTETSVTYKRKKRLEFKGISGDLSIQGNGDCDGIVIEKDGFAKVREEDETLGIKALSGDIKITTPRVIDLSLKGISGDITLDNLQGNTTLESVSGDITGTGLAGSLKGDIVSGDVDLAYTSLEVMHIRSRSGDIVIWLDDAIEAIIDIRNDKGTISCEFELLDEKRTRNTLTGTIKNPRGHIQIQNRSGTVSIRKLSHQDNRA